MAPSATAADGEVFTSRGKTGMVTPRALDIHEIPGIVEQFQRGAANAKAAGFDGVELHGANGYLLDQFVRDGTNRRTDAYGGSVRNRARFPLEVVAAVIEVWGASRVGYKFSPTGSFNSMSDSDPIRTFSLSGHGAYRSCAANCISPRLPGDCRTDGTSADARAASASAIARPVQANADCQWRVQTPHTGNAAIRTTATPISSPSACRSWPIRTSRCAISSRRRSTTPNRRHLLRWRRKGLHGLSRTVVSAMHCCGKRTKDKTMRTSRQELTLSSALSDPLIRTLMAADKVDPAATPVHARWASRGGSRPAGRRHGEACCTFALVRCLFGLGRGTH